MLRKQVEYKEYGCLNIKKKKKSVKKLKLNAACQFYRGGFPLSVFTARSSTECDGHGGEGGLGSGNRQLPLRLPCGLMSS